MCAGANGKQESKHTMTDPGTTPWAPPMNWLNMHKARLEAGLDLPRRRCCIVAMPAGDHVGVERHEEVGDFVLEHRIRRNCRKGEHPQRRADSTHDSSSQKTTELRRVLLSRGGKPGTICSTTFKKEMLVPTIAMEARRVLRDKLRELRHIDANEAGRLERPRAQHALMHNMETNLRAAHEETKLRKMPRRDLRGLGVHPLARGRMLHKDGGAHSDCSVHAGDSEA